MAKGRTSQPITIEVAVGWHDHPAIKELRAAGHVICHLGYTVNKYGREPDLILHPAAHGWDDAMFEQFTRKDGTPYRPYVDAAVKAGRQRRKKGK